MISGIMHQLGGLHLVGRNMKHENTSTIVQFQVTLMERVCTPPRNWKVPRNLKIIFKVNTMEFKKIHGKLGKVLAFQRIKELIPCIAKRQTKQPLHIIVCAEVPLVHESLGNLL